MVDCCIHDGFAGFRDFDKGFDLRFIYHYLNMLAVGVSDKSVGAIFKNITTEEIRRMRIPLVPLKAQERFGTLLHNIQKQRTCIAASLHQSEDLFGSLLQGAFRGSWGTNGRGSRSTDIMYRTLSPTYNAAYQQHLEAFNVDWRAPFRNAPTSQTSIRASVRERMNRLMCWSTARPWVVGTRSGTSRRQYRGAA
ncbi:MAG: restriction endonuclease subunit S [Flavobacteriales bacterium]|nr:restriction endonuclease subunit S [Flavobacteriales bacterium]